MTAWINALAGVVPGEYICYIHNKMALFILIALLLLIIGMFYGSYRTAKYYLVNYILNGKIKEIFSKEFLIVLGIVAAGFIITVYIGIRQPKYLEQGMDQLRESEFVKKKIGDLTLTLITKMICPKNPLVMLPFKLN